MRQSVTHAIVREQGVDFAVVSVKDHVASSPTQATDLIATLTPIYGRPVVVMGENSARLYGRNDIVRFLSRVTIEQLPWRQGWIDLPNPPARHGYSEPVSNEVEWAGASGCRYMFRVFPTRALPSFGMDGNYIFARRVGAGWTAVYIGQGDLDTRLGPSHEKWDAVHDKGALHVHVRLEASAQNRLNIESDLLELHVCAYTPTGCNVRTGG